MILLHAQFENKLYISNQTFNGKFSRLTAERLRISNKYCKLEKATKILILIILVNLALHNRIQYNIQLLLKYSMHRYYDQN